MPSVSLWAALFGPLIAALALVVPYLQWRTAHQKVVLDLFDRRFKIYEEVMGIIMHVVGGARATRDDLVQLREIKARAQFLFDTDVDQFLDDLLQI